MKDLLDIIHRGVAYTQDRSIDPARCDFIPRRSADLVIVAEISYEEIDELISSGKVKEQEYRGFVNLVFTYEGRKEYLVNQNFDFNHWREAYKEYMCCEKAIPSPCVCFVCIFCPDHGKRCHGSHD